MAGNTSTKKKFNDVKTQSVTTARGQRTAMSPNRGAVYDGQMSSPAKEGFAEPMNKGVVAEIGGGIDHLHNDIGESSGFETDGYIDKNGTPFGENAKFNFLPPGMDINNQENVEINAMPIRKLTEESYPTDGWMPKPRDLSE